MPADYNYTADQRGAYEIDLPAGQPVSFGFATPSRSAQTFTIVHHAGDKPIYFASTRVTPKAAGAEMLMPSSYVDYNIGADSRSDRTITIWVVSETAATVSVTRA